MSVERLVPILLTGVVAPLILALLKSAGGRIHKCWRRWRRSKEPVYVAWFGPGNPPWWVDYSEASRAPDEV